VVLTKEQIEAFALLAALVVGVGFFAGLVALLFFGYRRYEAGAKAELAGLYVGLPVRLAPEPGDVIVKYHTYHGVFVWHTETEHCVWLSPDAARQFLRRLLWFNLLWGWSAKGGVFVIPLAFYNYYVQRRSIDSQEFRNLRAKTSGDHSASETAQLLAEQLSPGRQFFICTVCAFSSLITGVFAAISYIHDQLAVTVMWLTICVLLASAWWIYAHRSSVEDDA
jgi:hypothetical protein